MLISFKHSVDILDRNVVSLKPIYAKYTFSNYYIHSLYSACLLSEVSVFDKLGTQQHMVSRFNLFTAATTHKQSILNHICLSRCHQQIISLPI